MTRCERCGAEVARGRGRPRRWCSDLCRVRARLAVKPSDAMVGLSPSDVGALGELVVCADLLRRGYHVYRAVSPGAPCDLLISTGNSIVRVEVTKGHRTQVGGALSAGPGHPPERRDVLALWHQDGTIIYRPELPARVPSLERVVADGSR